LAAKKRLEGDSNLGSYWAYGLFRFFKSLLGCLLELDADVLLNNISKFHPNLTLIENLTNELHVNPAVFVMPYFQMGVPSFCPAPPFAVNFFRGVLQRSS